MSGEGIESKLLLLTWWNITVKITRGKWNSKITHGTGAWRTPQIYPDTIINQDRPQLDQSTAPRHITSLPQHGGPRSRVGTKHWPSYFSNATDIVQFR
jgi:hypothetical protein